MSISGFFKGVGEITTTTLNIVAEASDSLHRSLHEYNLKLERQKAERTFTDVRDAIAYVADGKASYALLNNYIQYEWLKEHKEIDGRVVIIGDYYKNLFDDMYGGSHSNSKGLDKLTFCYTYKQSNYKVSMIPRRTDDLLICVHEVAHDWEEKLIASKALSKEIKARREKRKELRDAY